MIADVKNNNKKSLKKDQKKLLKYRIFQKINQIKPKFPKN